MTKQDDILAGIAALSEGQNVLTEAISNVTERVGSLEEENMQQAAMPAVALHEQAQEVYDDTVAKIQAAQEPHKVTMKNVSPEMASLAGQIKRSKGERIIRHANSGLLGEYVRGELPKHVEAGEKGKYAVQQGGLTDKFCTELTVHIERGGTADEVVACLPAKEVQAEPTDPGTAIIQQANKQPTSKAGRKQALTQACKRLGEDLTSKVLAEPDRHFRANGHMMRMNSAAVRQRLRK